jgi:DeoR/GlpR family transcriptional regulator of sugar metabolism
MGRDTGTFSKSFLLSERTKSNILNAVSSTRTRSSVPAAARLQKIRQALVRSPGVTVRAMARQLRVSEMTIRRDLGKLQDAADVRRTHGGAVVAERTVFEFSYQERQRARQAEKKAIAQAARELILEGQRIILDTGTTTLHLARLLKDMKALTVITPSLAVASELQYARGVRVVLLGGVLHPGSPDLTGPLTEHCLDVFSADWAFQGIEAIGKDGSVYNVDLQLAQVDRKMREKAVRSCLLADSGKFGATALIRSGSLEDFHILITDGNAPSQLSALARKMSCRVVTTKTKN